MTKKVLGFLEENALEGGYFRKMVLITKYYTIPKSKLVPVWLKSESVSLKWLEKWLKQNKELDSKVIANEPHAYIVLVESLFSAAKKKAGEDKDG